VPQNGEGPRSRQTVLTGAETGGLGEVCIRHPPGTLAPTPASRISLRAIGLHRRLLAGRGLDWGSGTGCLSIAAARIPAVREVIGLEISEGNVEAARANALLNAVADKLTFMVSDSYEPLAPADRERLRGLAGRAGFILANPRQARATTASSTVERSSPAAAPPWPGSCGRERVRSRSGRRTSSRTARSAKSSSADSAGAAAPAQ